MTRRSKIAKIMPIVNPSWLPFRVCSNDHAQLTFMPYIFFFKIKNCLNDDLFIRCDDRIGKRCITSAYLQWLCHSGERPVARGPLVIPSTEEYIIDPGLFEEKRGDMVFGFPWCMRHDAWCVVPSL